MHRVLHIMPVMKFACGDHIPGIKKHDVLMQWSFFYHASFGITNTLHNDKSTHFFSGSCELPQCLSGYRYGKQSLHHPCQGSCALLS
jgi:hypothetical protein